MKKSMLLMTCALLVSLLSVNAEAKMGIAKKFKAAYPTSKLGDCLTCHLNEDDYARNSYGTDLENNALDFKKIEALDSDTDGATNITEIKAGTYPGDMSSVPTL